MGDNHLTRRSFLRHGGAILATAAGATTLFGCAPATPSPATSAAPTSALAGAAVAATPTAAPAVANPVSITYWYWADSPPISQFFRETVDAFNARQKAVHVEAEAQPAFLPTREKLVTTAAAGAGGPDVSYANTPMAFEFGQAGLLRPIQDFFDKWPNKEDLARSAAETHRGPTGERPLLYMPWGIQVDYHYYRADQYKELGFGTPDTLDDVFGYARKLTKAPDRYGFGLRAADAVGFSINLLNYVSNAGVTYTDGKGNSDLDGAAAISMVSQVAQLYWDGIAQPSALQDRFPQMIALFQSGKISQWSGSINHAPQLAGANGEYEGKIGIAMFPKSKDTPRKSMTQSAGNMIMASSKNPDAAWEWITALMEPDTVEKFSKNVGFAPTLNSVAPRFANNRYFKLAADAEPTWSTFPWWHKNWNTLFNDTGPQLWQRVLQKQVTVESMMKQLADLMRAV